MYRWMEQKYKQIELKLQRKLILNLNVKFLESDFIQLLTLSVLTMWFLSVPHCESIHPLCLNEGNAESPNCILIGKPYLYLWCLSICFFLLHIYIYTSFTNLEETFRSQKTGFHNDLQKKKTSIGIQTLFSWSTKEKELVLDKLIIEQLL